MSVQSGQSAARAGLTFQISNVTPLCNGLLSSIARNAPVQDRVGAELATKKTGVLVAGRTRKGESVHVQLHVATGFRMRIPLSWSLTHVERMAKYLKADAGCQLQRLVNLVYYTPHLPGNNNFDEPQRLPYASFSFSTTQACDRAFQELRGFNGFRCYDTKLQYILKKAGFDPNQVKEHANDRTVFSVHEKTEPERCFFRNIDLMLRSKECNLASFESWITLGAGVKLLGADHYFANSKFNATILLSDIVACTNNNDSAPWSALSFDIEQYAPINTNPDSVVPVGARGFPELGDPEAAVRNICCSIDWFDEDQGKTVHRNVIYSVGAAVISPVVDFSLLAPQAATSAAETSAATSAAETSAAETSAAQQHASEVREELTCFDTEVEMLIQFGKLLEETQPDIVTGYNIAGYDIQVVYVRMYMYFICKLQSFKYLHEVWLKAKTSVERFDELRESTQGSWQSRQAEMRQLFALPEGAPCDIPQIWLMLSKLSHFDQASYSFFRGDNTLGVGGNADPERVDAVQRFFYCGRVPTFQLRMQDMKFESSQIGQLVAHLWQRTGFANMCMFMYLKKNVKLASYKLSEVMTHYFENETDKHKIDLPYKQMFEYMDSKDPLKLWEVAKYCMRDAEAPLDLSHKLKNQLDMRQKSALTRVSFEVLCQCGQQKIIWNALQQICEEQGYVMTDFEKAPLEYDGATVLSPVPGFYEEPVATLDFASLYPSIMLAINAGCSTLIRPGTELPVHARGKIKVRTTVISRNEDNEPTLTASFVQGENFGIVKMLLVKLLAAREAVKKQMAAVDDDEPALYSLLNSKQLAIKVVCNSVYGFFGVKNGKMPLGLVSASVTAEGRNIILQTKLCVETRYNLKVVYGDTDSVFVLMPGMDMQAAWKKAQEITKYITTVLFGPLRYIKLEAEKVYAVLLLLNKKRYAGAKSSNSFKVHELKLDCKGIQLVRRDSCALVKVMAQELLDIMLPLKAIGAAAVSGDSSDSSSMRASIAAVSAQCVTAPRIRQVLQTWIGNVLADKLATQQYVTTQTASAKEYKKNYPAHMLVYFQRNKRILTGLQNGDMLAPGERVRVIVVLEATNLGMKKPGSSSSSSNSSSSSPSSNSSSSNSSSNSSSSSRSSSRSRSSSSRSSSSSSSSSSIKSASPSSQKKAKPKTSAKKVSDHVEDPDWVEYVNKLLAMKEGVSCVDSELPMLCELGSSVQHLSTMSDSVSAVSSTAVSSTAADAGSGTYPAKGYHVKRSHYMKLVSQAIGELLQFHVPDVNEIFKAAIATLKEQEALILPPAKKSSKRSKRKATQSVGMDRYLSRSASQASQPTSLSAHEEKDALSAGDAVVLTLKSILGEVAAEEKDEEAKQQAIKLAESMVLPSSSVSSMLSIAPAMTKAKVPAKTKAGPAAKKPKVQKQKKQSNAMSITAFFI